MEDYAPFRAERVAGGAVRHNPPAQAGITEIHDMNMSDNHDFDAKRARNGESVQFSRGSLDGSVPQSWEDVFYIGPDVVRGGHIIQHADGSTTSTNALRMKPKTVTLHLNVYRLHNGEIYANVHNSKREADSAAGINRVKCVPVVFEI